MGTVHRAPADYPSGKQGDVLTVEFTVIGIPCLGLNGGPAFKHHEAFSFQVATDDQAETDRLWNAVVGNGGQESACGWCKDKWGLSWQITPRALTAAIADPDRAAAKRAFEAMMQMGKSSTCTIVWRGAKSSGRGIEPLTISWPSTDKTTGFIVSIVGLPLAACRLPLAAGRWPLADAPATTICKMPASGLAALRRVSTSS